MAAREKQVLLIADLFKGLFSHTNPKRICVGVSDLFVQISHVTGEVTIYSDADEVLGSCTIYSWTQQPNESSVVALAKPILAEVISLLESKGFWNNDLFERPFSVELVSEDFSTLEELLFLDDELVKVTTPILQGLSEELNNFLQELLPDIK